MPHVPFVVYYCFCGVVIPVPRLRLLPAIDLEAVVVAFIWVFVFSPYNSYVFRHVVFSVDDDSVVGFGIVAVFQLHYVVGQVAGVNLVTLIFYWICVVFWDVVLCV